MHLAGGVHLAKCQAAPHGFRVRRTATRCTRGTIARIGSSSTTPSLPPVLEGGDHPQQHLHFVGPGAGSPSSVLRSTRTASADRATTSSIRKLRHVNLRRSVVIEVPSEQLDPRFPENNTVREQHRHQFAIRWCNTNNQVAAVTALFVQGNTRGRSTSDLRRLRHPPVPPAPGACRSGSRSPPTAPGPTATPSRSA